MEGVRTYAGIDSSISAESAPGAARHKWSSKTASSVLPSSFARKYDGGIRPVVDQRDLPSRPAIEIVKSISCAGTASPPPMPVELKLIDSPVRCSASFRSIVRSASLSSRSPLPSSTWPRARASSASKSDRSPAKPSASSRTAKRSPGPSNGVESFAGDALAASTASVGASVATRAVSRYAGFVSSQCRRSGLTPMLRLFPFSTYSHVGCLRSTSNSTPPTTRKPGEPKCRPGPRPSGASISYAGRPTSTFQHRTD